MLAYVCTYVSVSIYVENSQMYTNIRKAATGVRLNPFFSPLATRDGNTATRQSIHALNAFLSKSRLSAARLKDIVATSYTQTTTLRIYLSTHIHMHICM